MMIGIVGSRRRNTLADFHRVLGVFLELDSEETTIVSGGCPTGADHFAEEIARIRQVDITICYAKWNRHGKPAGFMRNGTIAERADILVACVSKDRTGGTEDTIKKYLKHNKLTEKKARDFGLLFLV